MNVPNLLAISRIPAALVACGFVMYAPEGWQYWVCGILIWGAISDFLDGYIARKLDQVSTVGAFLDLTVDKVFICPLLFLIADDHWLEWIAVTVVTREFLVMGLRIYAATRQVVIPSHPMGKFKTGLLFPGIFTEVIDLHLLGIDVGRWLLVGAAAIALLSLVDYSIKARSMLAAAPPPAS